MSMSPSVKTALLSAIALVAIAAQLAAGVDTCPSYDTTHDVYNLKTLPYQCTSDLGDCADFYCKCSGYGSFNETLGECLNFNTSSGLMCDDVLFCTRIYALCVVVAFNNTNATCGGSWYTFIDEQVRDQLLNPEKVNESGLYDACSGYVCELVNTTYPNCPLTDNYSYICTAPFTPATPEGNQPTLQPLPPGADVPVPTTINGAPTVPVTRISAQVTFGGDFSAIFKQGLQSAAYLALKNAVGVSFTNKFGRTFICTNAVQGSLIATVATDVPQGQNAAINSVINNIKSLNSDSSTGWLSAITNACQAAGACASGVGAPTVKLSSITTTNIAATPNPPVQQTCGTGCVAGIIIACVAVAVIITAVTCVIVKRSNSAGTGTKANEPTETVEMKNDPQVV